jgi:membrane-associated protease RseP (regulator of RpoE activity)
MKTTPLKGMKDILPREQRIRDYVQGEILKTYRAAGFERISTPIMEDMENLDKSDGGDNLNLIFKVLKRGDKLAFASSRNETTLGIYVGMEHSIGDTSFPLRLVRAQFPKLAAPPIGQPCYDAENRLVGIVLGVSRKGTCHLLPAQAISFLAAHPEAKRVRLGCLLDINSSTPVIEGLINGGPLARGGIQTGDILISINGTTINNYGDMLDATYYLTGEKPLTIEVIRGTQVVKSRGIIPTQDSR